MQTIFTFSLIKFESPTYNDYTYDKTGAAVGWCLACSSMIVIPTFVCWKLFTTTGTLKQVNIYINKNNKIYVYIFYIMNTYYWSKLKLVFSFIKSI